MNALLHITMDFKQIGLYKEEVEIKSIVILLSEVQPFLTKFFKIIRCGLRTV